LAIKVSQLANSSSSSSSSRFLLVFHVLHFPRALFTCHWNAGASRSSVYCYGNIVKIYHALVVGKTTTPRPQKQQKFQETHNQKNTQKTIKQSNNNNHTQEQQKNDE